MPPWPNTPAKNRVRDRCLGDDDVVLELLNLARDGHVNVTGTVLAVGDDEAAEEGGVDLGLELDVLGAGHLLDLLGDHELLLVLELDSGRHGGNLVGKGWDRDTVSESFEGGTRSAHSIQRAAKKGKKGVR